MKDFFKNELKANFLLYKRLLKGLAEGQQHKEHDQNNNKVSPQLKTNDIYERLTSPDFIAVLSDDVKYSDWRNLLILSPSNTFEEDSVIPIGNFF